MWTATEISYVGGGEALGGTATSNMHKWVMDTLAPALPALPMSTSVGRPFLTARSFAGCSQLNANLYVSGGHSGSGGTIIGSIERVLF